MSTKLTEDVLRTKLRQWVLSAHLETTLNNGMSNDEIKKQVEFFVSCGLVEKTGERRGVKYRYKQDTSLIATVAKLRGKKTSSSIHQDDDSDDDETIVINNDNDDEEDLSEPPEHYNAHHSIKEYEKEKTANKLSVASLKDVDVVAFLTWLSNQTISDTSSISSFTVSFKKTRDNRIIVRAHSGITLLKELVISPAKFKIMLSKLDSSKEREEAIV